PDCLYHTSGLSRQNEYITTESAPPHTDSHLTHTDFAWYDSLSLARTSICAIRFSSCVTTSLIRVTPVQEFLPVVHRLRCLPRLRSRLTQSGRAFLWKP